MKEGFPLELNDWSNATIDSLFVIDTLVFESFAIYQKLRSRRKYFVVIYRSRKKEIIFWIFAERPYEMKPPIRQTYVPWNRD